MKGFYYDTLLDEENICNLDRERSLLEKGIRQNKKLVVYGPRNYGKTSLVKNVVIPRFQKRHKKSFVLFADLMEVKSLESIHQRIHAGFEKSFRDSFPARHLLEMAKNFLTQLKPEVSLDPLTGEPTLSLGAGKRQSFLPFPEIFSVIRERLSVHMPVLIVLDEFQDIGFIPEAQGLFRQSLQELKNQPVILMGSKRHILSDLFAKPDAPLASFGEDVEFRPIPYEDYYDYIRERFVPRHLTIGLETATRLQDALFRVPEAINIVCAFLCEQEHHKTIGLSEIFPVINRVVEGRRSRYEEWLSHFSEKEEEVLVALAKFGPVKQPTSHQFVKKLNMTPRTVSLTVSNFLDRGIVENTEEGYRLMDPLLFHFLRNFR